MRLSDRRVFILWHRPGLTLWVKPLLVAQLLFCLPLYAEEITDAKDLVRAAMDHWRGTNSYSEMTMTIHRPDWERSMSMRAWSEGDKLSLVRVTQPKKDAGNGTLLKDNDMWSYSPKINRIIKIPSSMMSQVTHFQSPHYNLGKFDKYIR